jgi:hypothetical protein
VLAVIALCLLTYGVAPASWPPHRVLAAPADIATVMAVVAVHDGGVIGPARAPITLPIQVTSVQRLGAATVEVAFDPALLRATDCQRNLIFDVGLCNIAVDRNTDGTPDAVFFNVVSLNGVSAGENPVALVQITWAAVETAHVALTTTLNVTVTTFTDPDATPLAVTAANGQITLAAVPADTVTPTATPTPTASPTATATPTATPTAPVHLIYLPLLHASHLTATLASDTPFSTIYPLFAQETIR